MAEKGSSYSKLVIHPKFNETINDLNRLKIKIPNYPDSSEMDFTMYNFPDNGEFVTNVEEIKNINLDAKRGAELVNDRLSISAYDESLNKFTSLEGIAVLISHSQIIHHKDDYLASNFLTLNFYTRAKTIAEDSQYVKYSEEFETESKKDYAIDRNEFLLSNTPNNSIIFIDGPLIGKQMSSYTIELNNKLLSKNVIPIFFVKNSTSNLVTNHIKELKDKYNSDMHWAYRTLKPGQRTNFFSYIDKYNKQNGKIFCYLKAFDVSPQRIEFHTITYQRYKEKIDDLMNVIFYLQLVQGEPKNPQLRSIAIAEKYARETLNLINFAKVMAKAGITPTINQDRFGWGG